MPTYEYECPGCGHSFERFQGINEDPIRECPECGGAVRRLISKGGGLVFRGPGFYATDYRSGPSSPAAASEKGGKGEGGDDAGSGAGSEKDDSD